MRERLTYKNGTDLSLLSFSNVHVSFSKFLYAVVEILLDFINKTNDRYAKYYPCVMMLFVTAGHTEWVKCQLYKDALFQNIVYVININDLYKSVLHLE